MYTTIRSAKTIGVMFIIPFFAYGIGSSLLNGASEVQSLTSGADTKQLQIWLGSLLVIVNSLTVLGIGCLMFPTLQGYHRSLAQTYLSVRQAEALLLLLGLAFLLTMFSVGEAHHPSEDERAWQLLESFAQKANFWAYQLAMLILGIGSLGLCWLLLKQGLVPRLLAIWGLVGYFLLFVGSILELYGLPLGIWFSIPGGLFELYFGVWLIRSDKGI